MLPLFLLFPSTTTTTHTHTPSISFRSIPTTVLTYGIIYASLYVGLSHNIPSKSIEICVCNVRNIWNVNTFERHKALLYKKKNLELLNF